MPLTTTTCIVLTDLDCIIPDTSICLSNVALPVGISAFMPKKLRLSMISDNILTIA